MTARIYFGRMPNGSFSNIDIIFPEKLRFYNYHYDNAVDNLIESLSPTGVYYTLNPLIPNYMEDDIAAELFWIIDADGNEHHMLTDTSMQKKLEIMGPGDVLCDDGRSWIDNHSHPDKGQ